MKKEECKDVEGKKINIGNLAAVIDYNYIKIGKVVKFCPRTVKLKVCWGIQYDGSKIYYNRYIGYSYTNKKLLIFPFKNNLKID